MQGSPLREVSLLGKLMLGTSFEGNDRSREQCAIYTIVKEEGEKVLGQKG